MGLGVSLSLGLSLVFWLVMNFCSLPIHNLHSHLHSHLHHHTHTSTHTPTHPHPQEFIDTESTYEFHLSLLSTKFSKTLLENSAKMGISEEVVKSIFMNCDDIWGLSKRLLGAIPEGFVKGRKGGAGGRGGSRRHTIAHVYFGKIFMEFAPMFEVFVSLFFSFPFPPPFFLLLLTPFPTLTATQNTSSTSPNPRPLSVNSDNPTPLSIPLLLLLKSSLKFEGTL